MAVAATHHPLAGAGGPRQWIRNPESGRPRRQTRQQIGRRRYLQRVALGVQHTAVASHVELTSERDAVTDGSVGLQPFRDNTP
jgi:hypothetical protein